MKVFRLSVFDTEGLLCIRRASSVTQKASSVKQKASSVSQKTSSIHGGPPLYTAGLLCDTEGLLCETEGLFCDTEGLGRSSLCIYLTMSLHVGPSMLEGPPTICFCKKKLLRFRWGHVPPVPLPWIRPCFEGGSPTDSEAGLSGVLGADPTGVGGGSEVAGRACPSGGRGEGCGWAGQRQWWKDDEAESMSGCQSRSPRQHGLLPWTDAPK